MIKNASPLIIYEDEQIIVCHKPAGTPTQSSHIGTSDMESLLKNHLFSSRKFHRAKSGEPYLAIIHRLDQPVEGILVFAKTPAAAKELNRQLTSQEFGKYYLAVISGIPEPQEGSLENYLVKDARTNSSAVCTKTTPGAKLARLHYRTIETYGAPGNEEFTDSKSTDTPKHTSRNHRQPPLQNESSALVEIHLDTGRHHQIRVQMAHFGHPIIGDRKYGKKITDHMNSVQSSTKRFQAGQLHLCAYKLTFRHPKTGKEMEFQI